MIVDLLLLVFAGFLMQWGTFVNAYRVVNGPDRWGAIISYVLIFASLLVVYGCLL